MQEYEKTSTIFDSIEFIFRHPWLFISPFVIILSVLFAKLSEIPLVYEASSVVSFEAKGVEISSAQRQTSQTSGVNDLIRNVMLGQGPREIIKEVWPDADEKADPKRYDSLRGFVQAISMKYDPKDNFLTIAFRSEDANFCYKMVQAAIKALRKEIKESTKKRLETGLAFLKKQEEYYRDKIKRMDEEVTDIKIELQKKSSDLTDEQRILISEIIGMREGNLALRDQSALQKLAKYDEILAGLQLELLEAEKRKNSLEEAMGKDDFTDFMPSKQSEGDVYILQYDKEIADKEFEILNLTLQGYLPDHPQIKKLKNEIETLKKLKEKRMEMLQTETSEDLGIAKQNAEEYVKDELKKLKPKIETLKAKIDLMAKKSKEASPQPIEGHDTIADLASRLKELRDEKVISEGYYGAIRRQLSEAELKKRIEEEEYGLDLIIVEKPKVPTGPIPFQKTPKLIWGFMLSVLVGSGFAYAAESLDNSVKSATELRELLHIPILGSVDKISAPAEIRLDAIRRNSVIIGLLVFVLSVKFLLKLKLFQILFKFLE